MGGHFERLQGKSKRAKGRDRSGSFDELRKRIANESATLRQFIRNNLATNAEEFNHLMGLSGEQMLFEIRIFVDKVIDQRKRSKR